MHAESKQWIVNLKNKAQQFEHVVQLSTAPFEIPQFFFTKYWKEKKKNYNKKVISNSNPFVNFGPLCITRFIAKLISLYCLKDVTSLYYLKRTMWELHGKSSLV